MAVKTAPSQENLVLPLFIISVLLIGHVVNAVGCLHDAVMQLDLVLREAITILPGDLIGKHFGIISFELCFLLFAQMKIMVTKALGRSAIQKGKQLS